MWTSVPSMCTVLWTLLVVVMVPNVGGNISIYNVQSRVIEMSLKDAPALFGGSIPYDGLRGLLVSSFPRNACLPVRPPPMTIFRNPFGKWFLLMQRGNCSFETKVRNAQDAGYQAAIVYNVNSSALGIEKTVAPDDEAEPNYEAFAIWRLRRIPGRHLDYYSDLEPMGADNDTGIIIPAVLIGSEDGLTLRDNFLYNSGFYACIEHDLPFDITMNMLLIFSILVGVCFLGVVVFILVKFFKDRRRQRRHCLPNSSVKKLTAQTFEENSPFEMCVICLDEFVVGDQLCVLPCMHGYHMKCIIPWLTKNRRVCPICKRKVVLDSVPANSSDSDESEDEDRPLLPSSNSNSRTANTNTATSIEARRRRLHGILQSMMAQTHSLARAAASSEESSPFVTPTPSPSPRSRDLVTNVDWLTSMNEAEADTADHNHGHDHDHGNGETTSLFDEPSVNA